MTTELTKSSFDLPTPTWEYSSNHHWGHLLRVFLQRSQSLFARYVTYRGNKVAYLRSLGVRIGPDCDILTEVGNFGTEPWLIELGRRVTLTQGVILVTHDGSSRVFRHTLPESSPWGNRFGTIRVLDNSFIGVNSVLLPGVTIGPDSIVGVGSVVTKDVPPGMVAAGVPAKVLYPLETYIERYKEKMVAVKARNRQELRAELTQKLWGQLR